MSSDARTTHRVVSLDQFRGYTVAGMFLVNFLGGFAVTWDILKHHHDYCSYADTIMPQFLFAVGFAFRLTFERRVQQHGVGAAYRRVTGRLMGLILLSLVIYTVGRPADTWDELTALGPWAVLGRALKRDWFQTLMHIAVTSLWILPFIRSRTTVRITFAAVSAFLHVGLSWWFNFEWCNSGPNAIDGGPLGFLTWTIPAIAGTIACDLVTSGDVAKRWTGLISGSAGLMLFGWIASCGTRFYDVPADQVESRQHLTIDPNPVIPRSEQLAFGGLAEPPFVAPPDASRRKWNYWMMSQRAGTLSYLMFGAGVSMAVFSLFHLMCDCRGHELYVFRVFGSNALTGYVFHLLVMDAVDPFVPRDSPAWYVAIALMVFFGITWTLVRHLEKNKIYLRL